MKHKFITLEGIEGAGKSTQAKLLFEKLKALGNNTILTREPGGVKVAEAIRNILLHEDIEPLTELLLYEAARAEHYLKVIKPALDEGKIVICDRFTDATVAYQGYGRKMDLNLISTLNNIATNNKCPNLSLIVDIPAELAFERLKKRGLEPDRFERLDLNFYIDVRNGYLEQAKKEPKRVFIIDGTKSIEAVHKEIMGIVL